jgi:hypothetical protein
MKRIDTVLVPAEDLALVPLDVVKEELGIPPEDTSQDARLTRYIAQVSAQIHTYTQRIFPLQTYRNEFYREWSDPDGSPLVVSAWPIVEIVSLTEDGVPVVAPDDYIWKDKAGLVYRRTGAGFCPWAAATTVLDFSAGYAVIPADLEAAALSWLSVRWGGGAGAARDPTIRGETIPDLITVTYGSASSGADATSMPAGVKDMLTPYMRPALA